MTFFTAADLDAPPRESMLARVSATLALWRRRSRERAELGTVWVRDARDLAIPVEFEINKPFWRA
jgi:uncharacterized protein YjiS (DUF1127 family)